MITYTDLRNMKLCRRGIRLFFDEHGLDWDKFREEGISEEDLLSTGDAMAYKVVEEKNNGRV
jgi:hypothetical protein